jgi:hypothetical protein
MFSFWDFVPKSGVAFIFLSVITIVVWNRYRSELTHPYFWIFTIETGLLVLCFYLADKESEKNLKK